MTPFQQLEVDLKALWCPEDGCRMTLPTARQSLAILAGQAAAGPTGPQEVVITNPSPIIDIEYVCDESTDTWHKLQTVTPVMQDGTLGAPVETNTDTGISCDLPKPDYEAVRVCDATTKTIHLVDYSYAEDGTKTEIGRVDTGEACDKDEQRILTNKQCYSVPNSLVNTTFPADTSQVPITEDIVVFPNDNGEITSLDIWIANNTPGNQPAGIEVDGTEWPMTSQPVNGVPNGIAAAGVWKYTFTPAAPYTPTGGQLTISATAATNTALQWSTSSTTAGDYAGFTSDTALQAAYANAADGDGQLDPLSNNEFAKVLLRLEGEQRYELEFYSDGTTQAFDQFRREISSIPVGAVRATCSSNEVVVDGPISISTECKDELAEKIATAIAGNESTTVCYELEGTPVIVQQGSGASGGNSAMAYFNAGDPDMQWTATANGEFDIFQMRTVSFAATQVDIEVINTATGQTATGSIVGSGNNQNIQLSETITHSTGDLITFNLTFADVTGWQWRNSDPTNPANATIAWSRTGQINEAGANLLMSVVDKATIVTAADGSKTGTDGDGVALTAAQITDVEDNWTQVDCDGADDVTIIGGEISLTQETIDALNEVKPLNSTTTREKADQTVTAPYRAVSITAISGDVTIDGASVPASFNWSIDSNQNQEYTDDVVITGSDYILTVVKET